MSREKFAVWTEADIRRIFSYRDRGLKYSVIAELMGVPGTHGEYRIRNLIQRVSSNKRNLTPKHETFAAERAALVDEYLRVKSITALAKKYAVSYKAMHKRLAREGVGPEILKDLDREFDV